MSLPSMRAPFVVLVGFLWGCGASLQKANPPRSEFHKTKAAVDESLPPVIARRTPHSPESCPLFFPPHDIGNVIRIAGATMALAMNPAMSALCACSKPGEYATIVARIDFGRGTVNLGAPDSAPINECLETLHVTFEPPPQSDLPGSDCINCGPRYYGVFPDSPPPPKETGLKLMYSFLVDRSGEVLDCPDNTHAERGSCAPDAVPIPAKAEKHSCGCEPADLNCAMACASKN